MGWVVFWRHFGNNYNILFLRRIYAHMRLCVSKLLQNARNMRCWRLYMWQYRMCRIEYSPSINTSIPMKLDQKQEKDQRGGLICAKLKLGSHWGFLRSRIHRYCKNLEIFMACIFFFFSSGIWDKVEAIWLFRVQMILWVPVETIYRWGNYTVNYKRKLRFMYSK